MLAYKVITEYASAVYGNLVMTLQGELLFCSVSYIFTHGVSYLVVERVS